MKVQLRALSAITPYEKNPRLNDDAVAAVAESITKFGFRQPIVVDPEGVIVCGHTRFKAAQELGMEKAPVHVATDLTPEQIRAYRIADNRTAELSEWDMELLPLELADLQDAGLDWSLLGFDERELQQMLDPGVTAGLTDPDAIPEPPDEPVTARGDIWILGDHRLLCGDSSAPDDVRLLLAGEPIHLVNTDPPYNVAVQPRSNNAFVTGQTNFAPKKQHATKRGRGIDAKGKAGPSSGTTTKLRAKDRPLENDFVSDEEFERLLAAWFGNASAALEPGRAFYIWGGYANIANYPGALTAAGLKFSQQIIWHKMHPVISRKDFMGDHEWCQPPDTQVLTAAGSSSIQSLRDGDRVVSFSRHSSAVVGLRHGMEVRTAQRHFKGSLYGVVVGDRETWCTGGHVWSVKMSPQGRDLWCVYLMNRGPWWRVGISKMQTTWGFGLKQRLSMEDGEAAWALSVHSNREEAQLAEHIISTSYGIPTAVWRVNQLLRRTEQMIRRIYEALDADSLERAARRALRDHNRDILHPLLTRGRTRPKIGCRVPLFVRACNLLPDVMAVPVPGRGQRFDWTPIRAVDVQSYSGPVHSMDVEKHHHYIADGIVTHNCFYGWREGAAHVFLGPNNVPDVWQVKKVNPQSMVHLTEKPVELAVRAMQYSSRPGEHVLDLFGGSGSTLIAAEQTGRRAFLMEIDPAYCDVVVQRWEELTGKKAERMPVSVATEEKAPAVAEAGSDV